MSLLFRGFSSPFFNFDDDMFSRSLWRNQLLQQQRLLQNEFDQHEKYLNSLNENNNNNNNNNNNQQQDHQKQLSSSSSSSSSQPSSSPPSNNMTTSNNDNKQLSHSDNNKNKETFFPLSNIKCDAIENDKSFIINAELPGIPPENINVTLDNGVIQISGEKKNSYEDSKKDDKGNIRYHHIERSYGKFSRSFGLPNSCLSEQDKIKVTHNDNAILTIEVPKNQNYKEQQNKRQLTIEKANNNNISNTPQPTL